MSATSTETTQERIYPLKKPKNHIPPVPRWTLRYPEHIDHLFIAYIGVQSHGGGDAEPTTQSCRSGAVKAVKSWLNDPDHRPVWVEHFKATHGYDIVGSDVWVCYWTNQTGFESAVKSLDLVAIHARLGQNNSSIGLWCETFHVPLDFFETNYAGNDYQPGVAKLPDTSQERHTLSQYWGAARDRVPASGWDLFEKAAANDTKPAEDPPNGLGEVLTGQNEYDNMVHIRSGQWWEECSAEERAAYETDLQKALMGGMDYLWTNPQEAGTLGLRFLQNVDPKDDQTPRLETCAAGFHRSLHDLEKWSRSHPSHLKIFNGARKHAEKRGEGRKFRTWHEIAVLKKGEAKWTYVNCTPETGVIKYVGGMKIEKLVDVAPSQPPNKA